MFSANKLTDFFIRLGIGLALGLLIGFAIGEVAYLLTPNKEAPQRGPEVFEFVIPAGTAAKMERGEASTVLPDGMEFVEGDTLRVKNEDSDPHQLGPLFIPPKTSAQLALETANAYTYACSFQSDQYVGLVVQPRVTLSTRIEGVMATGLPTGMMLMVYSYLMPARKNRQRMENE
jgi:hypothetical protein